MSDKVDKLGQEPAFGAVAGTPQDGYLQEGMTKRFYAACAAMQGLLANPRSSDESQTSIINASYDIADKLLKQEDK